LERSRMAARRLGRQLATPQRPSKSRRAWCAGLGRAKLWAAQVWAAKLGERASRGRSGQQDRLHGAGAQVGPSPRARPSQICVAQVWANSEASRLDLDSFLRAGLAALPGLEGLAQEVPGTLYGPPSTAPKVDLGAGLGAKVWAARQKRKRKGPTVDSAFHLPSSTDSVHREAPARAQVWGGDSEKIKQQNHSTQDSHVVPHHGTNWAALRLTAQIGRDAVLSESYGRG
jgi:hypothetical protein